MHKNTLVALFVLNGLALAASPQLSVKVSEVAPDQVRAVITVSGARDLDTYSFDVNYDTASVSVIASGISLPALGILNALDNGQRQIIPMIKKDPAVVHIAATVVGNAPVGSVPDNGVLGVVQFTKRTSLTVRIFLTNAALLDGSRNRIPCDIVNGEATGK